MFPAFQREGAWITIPEGGPCCSLLVVSEVLMVSWPLEDTGQGMPVPVCINSLPLTFTRSRNARPLQIL